MPRRHSGRGRDAPPRRHRAEDGTDQHTSRPDQIGDGDQRDELTSAGVTVTGWLTPAEVETVLRGCSVYLHSASYEGFPLSVLDAAGAGLPIVVRDLACFEGSPLLPGVSDPEHAAQQVRELLTKVPALSDSLAASAQLAAASTNEAQTHALWRAYSAVMETAGARRR
ncbi:glycosyltransferase family 4 protein [Galactobacter caseinivorans]|uniref:Glycosyltransferase n=1 Tax=Galactobacter caseinivorans TaxID=2676123 RepID=A0A496PHT9_9MICC|nr:glycosyltransferase family 4 protein [Galactobacter caseinivorans]RKW70056.1 glycosyltransferase [Galactobacter caseinivorans]